MLAWDALRREKEFRRQKNWADVIKKLKGVELTKDGIRLVDAGAVELVFVRLSVRRSIWGTTIVTLGFVALLASRILETLARAAEHAT